MSRPYRSLDFNNERKWKATSIIDDVTKVGIHKALGYASSAVGAKYKENCKDYDLDQLAIDLQTPDTYVTLIDTERTKRLWVGHHQMMEKILNAKAEVVIRHGWPTTPKEFFDRISQEQVPHDTQPELYHVVCDLFNSWCLWCERPIPKKFVDGSTRFLSQYPYDPDNE